MKTIRRTVNQKSTTKQVTGFGSVPSLNILCPNCGSAATRQHIQQSDLVEVACHTCDYFLVLCNKTGNVIEAYAPGLYFNNKVA